MGEEITAIELKPYTSMGELFCRSSTPVDEWTITPELPSGLQLNVQSGKIDGTPDVLNVSVVFTIVAISEGQVMTTTLAISIGSCEYGEYLFAVKKTGDGQLVIRQGENVLYNNTLRRFGPHSNPICIPKQDYEYEYSCDDHSECIMYIRDDLGNYYANVRTFRQMEAVRGRMEVVPTKAPTFLIPNMLSFALEENLDEFIRVEGIHSGNITITPELPNYITLQDSFLVRGKSVYPILNEYTITASNAIGTTKQVFTLAIGQCPQGMEMIEFDIDKRDYPLRYELYSTEEKETMEEKIPIYSTLQRSYPNPHSHCLASGSYKINMITLAEKPGWGTSFGMAVKNKHGVIARFNLPQTEFKYTRHFNYEYAVEQQEEWKITTEKQTTEKWTTSDFDDKLWNTAQAGTWGTFTKEIESVFVRKAFKATQPQKTYSHMQIAIQYANQCEITVYLNGKAIIPYIGGEHTQTSISTFPISLVHDQTNILSAEIHRSSTAPITAPIDFDIHVLLVSSMSFLQSIDGVASDVQKESSPENNPNNAFYNGWSRGWKVFSFPAILRYTFAENSPKVVNRVIIGNVENIRPTQLRVEGVNVDNSTEVLYTVNSSNFLYNGEETIHMENSKAFHAYQIVFLQAEREDVMNVRVVRFLTGLTGQCKRQKGLEATYPGITRYAPCPFNKVGIRQLHCQEEEFGMQWKDDLSTCLKKTPTFNTTFVDWVFEITNFTKKSWGEKQASMEKLLTERFGVKQCQIDFIFALDASTEDRKALHVIARLTAEAELGDYLMKHLSLFKPEFNEVVKRELQLADNQVASILSIQLHHQINMNSVIVASITFVVTLLMVGSVYWMYLCCKRSSSLKSNDPGDVERKDDRQSLLA